MCPFFSVVSIPVFTIESEDCLYLNIYKPKNRSGLAVMIHGGGLTSGSADKFNIKILASAFGNAIVVTFNYRVGIFGFLSNMDEHAMGNNGLWDRRLVFQWVKKFTHSFGAVGCSLHAEINRNLFQRAITNSGSSISVLNNMSVVARRNAINIAEDVRSEIRKEDCNNKGKLADIVKCVRNMDVQK
ncbi:CES1P-like protein [Mya arenaria]|uniref:CES1P-like protein n=1 Tax=Mya arenaria TaxID=6604 RepID=A0ABY7EWY2_MYAAR|nr:CES1P-like protein [Mya arenaria]